MGRRTQFIGMTKEAEQYVKDLIEVPKLARSAYGMFDEEIPLHAYKDVDGTILIETVQCEPWSHGLMIFTSLSRFQCELELKFVRNEFEWISDPAVRGFEYDRATGTFYV